MALSFSALWLQIQTWGPAGTGVPTCQRLTGPERGTLLLPALVSEAQDDWPLSRGRGGQDVCWAPGHSTSKQVLLPSCPAGDKGEALLGVAVCPSSLAVGHHGAWLWDLELGLGYAAGLCGCWPCLSGPPNPELHNEDEASSALKAKPMAEAMCRRPGLIHLTMQAGPSPQKVLELGTLCRSPQQSSPILLLSASPRPCCLICRGREDHDAPHPTSRLPHNPQTCPFHLCPRVFPLLPLHRPSHPHPSAAAAWKVAARLSIPGSPAPLGPAVRWSIRGMWHP